MPRPFPELLYGYGRPLVASLASTWAFQNPCSWRGFSCLYLIPFPVLGSSLSLTLPALQLMPLKYMKLTVYGSFLR